MTGIGIVGIGFMGMAHFEAAKKLKRGKVTAIATRNPKKRAGDWSSIQGNFGPRGSTSVDLSNISSYKEYRDLLDDDSVNLVDVCLPTDQHESVVIDALKAGKHVFVEKPIAVDLSAARRMVKAADKHGCHLMVGHVLPFFPEFRFALEAISEEKYGKLKAAHFRRMICPPSWSKDMAAMERMGGYGIDLHIHDNHFIRAACGMPNAVFATGDVDHGRVKQTHTNYVFNEKDITITSVSGGLASGGLKFVHGYELYFEKATVEFEAGTYGDDWVVNRELKVITNSGRTHQPKLKGGIEWCSAFTEELQIAVNVLEKQGSPGVLSSQMALDALEICYAEAKSIESGRVVKLKPLS